MRKARFVLLVAVAFACACAATTARAQGLELRADPTIEVPLTIVAGAGWFAAEGSKKSAIAVCRWCDRDAAGNDSLNVVDASVRSALKWDDIEAADTWSNVAAAGAGTAAIGELFLVELADRATARFPSDALMLMEAVTFAGAVNGAVKLGAARERPFVHALAPDQKQTTKDPSDNNASFYSGHASVTFALAAASGTIATLRGYRLAPVIWGSGMTLAVATSYLRIAADRHYFSDVAVGALAGTAIGVCVPLLFHGRDAPSTPSARATSSSLAAQPLVVGVTLPL